MYYFFCSFYWVGGPEVVPGLQKTESSNSEQAFTIHQYKELLMLLLAPHLLMPVLERQHGNK